MNKTKEIKEFCIIAVSMILGSLGWCAFLLPHQITIGGLGGISSVLFWGTGIPIPYTYAVVNGILMIAALKLLGWRFCVRTIFAVTVFSFSVGFFQKVFEGQVPFAGQTFLACVVGGVIMGVTMGVALQYNASTGGSDVIAAIVNKYRDISLGRVILMCDLCVITSSYLVLESWEKVIYGYITLCVMSWSVDYVINGMRSSVQFFIISDKYQEIGEAINEIADRGCTMLNGNGFFTKKDKKVIFCIAKKSESNFIFELIDEIDPNAFVAQSAVVGVYGQGFDHVKKHRKIDLEELREKMTKEPKEKK